MVRYSSTGSSVLAVAPAAGAVTFVVIAILQLWESATLCHIVAIIVGGAHNWQSMAMRGVSQHASYNGARQTYAPCRATSIWTVAGSSYEPIYCNQSRSRRASNNMAAERWAMKLAQTTPIGS